MNKTVKFTITCLVLSLCLSSCGKSFFDREKEEMLTDSESGLEQYQTQTGFIRPIEIDVDEGSHILLDNLENEEILFILESEQIDLDHYMEKEIEASGYVKEAKKGNIMIMTVDKIVIIDNEETSMNYQTSIIKDAPNFDPPYNFDKDDEYEVLKSYESAGIKVIRVTTQEDGSSYLVKLVSNPNDEENPWSIFEVILEEGNEGKEGKEGNEGNEGDEGEEEEEEEEKLTNELPIVIESANFSDEVNQTHAEIINYFQLNLSTILPSDAPATDNPNLNEVSFTGDNHAYLEYSNADEKGMILVSFDSANNVEVIATFKEGETTDWIRLNGTNTKKTSELEVYKKKNASWKKSASLKANYAGYEELGNYKVQYPQYWYYWQKGGGAGILSQVSFSNKPVEEDNILLTIKVLSQDYDSSITNIEGIATKTPITIGEIQGEKHVTTEDTIIIYLPKGDNQTFVFEATKDQEDILMNMLPTLENTAE